MTTPGPMAVVRCARCRRVLTDPASWARQLGPVCAALWAEAAGGAPLPRRRPRAQQLSLDFTPDAGDDTSP